MKKIIVLLLLVFAFSTPAKSWKFYSGISSTKLDWDITGVGKDIFDKPSTRAAIFAGTYLLERRYYEVSAYFGYVGKGGKGDFYDKSTGEWIEISSELEYFVFTPQFDLIYPANKKLTPYISFGLHYDVLFSYNHSLLQTLDNNGELNKNSFGIVIGGGVKYDLGPVCVGVRADYLPTFNPIAESHAGRSGVGETINDNTFTFGLTLEFPGN